MECTQRLECTQELYETHTERVCPEQIGFLGICGAKHPVLRGPNKIGRDPQTCNIVLNLNSVSRQHAVINVLNSKEYMLMDLDSANKTKLLNKILQPYMPHPIRNGDTVQFGDIFGIFRLLEEDDELPMTQAIDIPDTPVPSKHVSKLTKVPITMIPESPDVSDRDESFLTPTQLKNEKTRLSSGQFIKPFGKTIPIHRVSSPHTDTSHNSSKRSIHFEDNPDTSLNESLISLKVDKKADDIHEMDTQVPYPVTNPTANESTDSIYMADTQIPPRHGTSPSIHTLDTQIPTTEHLPQVRKISDQEDMQFDIYAANKENDLSIFNAETQPFICEKEKSIDNKTNLSDVRAKPINNMNKSEEELLFDEIEDECFENLNSQPILPQDSPEPNVQGSEATSKLDAAADSDNLTDCEDIDMACTQKVEELPIQEQSATAKEKPAASKRRNRVESDNSTDCEDIELMQTQKIPELPVVKDKTTELAVKQDELIPNPAKRVNRIQSDSSTDCEDLDMMPTQKIPEKKPDDDLTDCEDEVGEVTSKKPNKPVDVTKFEDMPTQVINVDHDKIDKPAFEEMDTQIICIDENVPVKSDNINNFEDQATQIIDPIFPNNEEVVKQSLNEIDSPFKIPLQSPIRVKSKEIPKVLIKIPERKSNGDENYYNATQDIFDDLCTQRDGSPILKISSKTPKDNDSPIIIDDDVVPCSVEDYKVGEKFANIDKELTPTKSLRVKKIATCLSSQEVRDVIGVDAPVDSLKKFPSDSSSDVESTPKKVRPFLFTDSDLPDSQEIKSNIVVNHTKSYSIESSSESEPEQNTEEQYTPFVHRKKRSKPVAKIDLTKKFDVEKLPERIITRVRKPTPKMEANLQLDKKVGTNILKPTFLTEQDNVDQDIVTENMKRLKSYEKAKGSKDVKNENKAKDDNHEKITIEDKTKDDKNENAPVDAVIVKEIKNESKSTSQAKSKEPKEKIKVKIEKPKKKETESKSKSKEHTTRKNKEDDEKRESNRKSKEKSSITQTEETTRKSENKSKEDSLNSTSDAKIHTRSTRTRRKGKETKTAESKSASPEKSKEELVDNNKKRPTRKRAPPKESTSPEVEIRRSKRQVKVKENKSDSQTIQAPKSILKKSIHEQSTVYNVSSSSGESPRTLKRSLADDSEVPSPKRTRAFVNNVNNSINNASLRATPARTMKTQHVLLTAFPSEEVKQKLEKLGAVIVTDVMQCSVVLTMQVKRTFKLLCAVGLGRPIVGPGWVQACVDTHMIVDPWLYLVKDESAEKRFQFSLERTLNGKRDFLKGYNVSSTPSVQPNGSEMKLIVECSGGTWKEGGSNWICVSSTKDRALWPALRKRGATVVSTEFILGGVLKQKLDINSNKFP